MGHNGHKGNLGQSVKIKVSPPSRVARPLGSWLEVFGGKPSTAWTLALRLALKEKANRRKK